MTCRILKTSEDTIPGMRPLLDSDKEKESKIKKENIRNNAKPMN